VAGVLLPDWTADSLHGRIMRATHPLI